MGKYIFLILFLFQSMPVYSSQTQLDEKVTSNLEIIYILTTSAISSTAEIVGGSLFIYSGVGSGYGVVLFTKGVADLSVDLGNLVQLMEGKPVQVTSALGAVTKAVTSYSSSSKDIAYIADVVDDVVRLGIGTDLYIKAFKIPAKNLEDMQEFKKFLYTKTNAHALFLPTTAKFLTSTDFVEKALNYWKRKDEWAE